MLIRVHRAIASDAPSWRFWRGVLIGFVAGCILVTTILREGRPEQRVHTIDPRADGPAVLTEGAPSNAARRA